MKIRNPITGEMEDTSKAKVLLSEEVEIMKPPKKPNNKKTVKPKSKSKSKSKVINVSPGKPYYSSKELGEGYEERLPSAVYSANLRKRSPFGKASPKAAGLDVVAESQNLFRGKEGKTGSRLAKKTAKELVKKNAGGKVINKRSGGSMKKGLDKASKSLKNRESKVERSTLGELGKKYMEMGVMPAVKKALEKKFMTPKPKKKRYLMEAKGGGKVKGYKKGGPITYRMSGGQVVGHGYD